MSNNGIFLRILSICSVLIILIQSSVISQVILDPDAVVEEIVSGIQQPEGPVWREGLGLLFSDIKGNKIYKWTSEKGKEIYLDPSYNTNGLAYDLEGRLVAGQMGLRRVVRFEKDGSQTSLADSYDGKKLNSPNDLVIKSDGAIFFTDPDFNIPLGESKELSFNGVYRISPSGVLQLLTSSLTLPNGICFSPDESKLYVNDSQVHKIYVWDVVDDSTITNKKLLYTIPVPFSYADGMKIDVDGNIYCTCSSYVWVISPEGELIGKIALPSNVSASNCAWGDDDNRTLFITAGNSVYRVRPFVTSINKEDSSLPNSFELSQNYPNPFNPTTKITYSIPITSNVMITVYDVSGKEVVTIENCQKKAGTYTLLFNAEKLASGVYYYNLTANEFSSTKKFVILK
ncbi:MAG TPA: SMP-30/gluconolactonase/LRE family protein [Candidatus Marinimicrobia bacterium]|nr:SMP-30/gluconolactonase/LRE family protein [Candidatus Neomarinimicrobiota bacterium]HQH55513.1 SMP-30/gluconolactonase/LRE family protein [Candidatus Neomarinimicrobiota bacterium]HQK11081.1 SMP-30/gluconolactonase/LRE family protein [Candidatus Neomarinimicrobiota bacterium]